MTYASLQRLMMVLNTALPYLFPPMDGIVELMVKLLDVICSFKGFRAKEGENSDCHGKKVDFEGLLSAMSTLCSEQEREMIERIGGMFRALSFYEMYQGMFSQGGEEQNIEELLKKVTGNEGINLEMIKALSSVMMSSAADTPSDRKSKDENAQDEKNAPGGETSHEDDSYDELISELENSLSPEERKLYSEFKSIFS